MCHWSGSFSCCPLLHAAPNMTLHGGSLNLTGPLLSHQVGRGVVRRSGKDVALVGYGTAVNNCLAAAEMLAANGISATVADMR